MASAYFSLIHKELHTILFHAFVHVDDDESKLQQYTLDAQFIEMFNLWFESLELDYTAADFRSMITHLKTIWVQKEEDDWPQEIHDFDPITFGLESKIEQSKLQIEQLCEILLRSPMQCKCKSPTNENINEFMFNVSYNLSNLYRYRAAKLVQFQNQIDILIHMLPFLFHSMTRVFECIDSKELIEYRNFVHGFFVKAACLACLYWAKEANDETAAEMNIALFDILHKIKPCAADVIACYFSVLKSNNLLQPDDSICEGQTLAKFVDFFFEHTILKDVFKILRERLILLFTFLSGAPHEYSEEEDGEEEEEEEEEEGEGEGDVDGDEEGEGGEGSEEEVRSQIYDLFREDGYLLLPVNEMEEDFFNKKMLLMDFIKVTSKITKLGNWNRLEAEKMNNISFASIQRELSSMQEHAQSISNQVVLDQVIPYLTEIRFLRLFLQCFETWDDSDEETWVVLCSVITSLKRIWGPEFKIGLLSGRLYGIRKEDIADWEHLLDYELKENFQMSKQEISAWLVSLTHCSFHCWLSRSSKILKFLDSIRFNIASLVFYGACNDALNEQIDILSKILLLQDFLKLSTNCTNSKNLKGFKMLAQVFANNAACLIYLYWANHEIPSETNLILSNMLQKIKPDTCDVARMYIGSLKAICLQPYDYLLFEQTAMSFVDYFFEDLVIPWKNDFQILRDEVLFYLTFVHQHHYHTGNVEEIICSQLDVLFNERVYDLLPFDDMKEDFSKKNVGLSDFMMEIGSQNSKIRQLYCKFPDSFLYDFPRIIGQGFLDCLIQKIRNLKERMISDRKSVPSAENNIKTVETELVYLIPIFNQILELKELNDAWLEVVNVIYLADHVISLCYIFYHLIWHYIPYLSVVVDKIKAVKTKLEKIEECNMHINSRCPPHPADLISTLLEQDWTSEIVGFEVDEKIIIDNITRGTKSLDIVSIVGIGGLGKTTLAKKVYDSSLVKSHFNVLAFTYVSQDHNKRRILLDILKDIVGIDAKTSCLTDDDLAHKLKKCLIRQKYLIVLDDIWNINAWDEVRSSFPDNRNGSRVMFTTRSLEVAKKGQIQCSPHCLSFLTEDESWKLLQKKVFHDDMPLPNLSNVAQVVAKKCNGLPLAIVVIAGILARTETNLWMEISKRVSSYLLDEGCMNILELSYRHLPEYLKPCLLYLGAFPEECSYRVRQVTLLWISEGFIKESETKSLKDVAKEHLYELFKSSFIIVDETSIGEIHTFRVHGLIHGFCQRKARDENFFQLRHGTAARSFSDPSIYNHYRVSLQKLCDTETSLANTRSLLYFPLEFSFSQRKFPLGKFRSSQVLHLKGIELQEYDLAHMTSLIDLRHIEAQVSGVQSFPSSISNLSNLQSLILKDMSFREIDLPETLWRMKSLRHVKVSNCKFEVSDGYELNVYPQLDNVESFSRPVLSTGKDVEWLLQRLPVVRKLSCILDYKSIDSIEERVATFEFHRKLESLKLFKQGTNCPYLINFPSTLIKLMLVSFELSSTSLSAIAELQNLRILKLRFVSFLEPTWEMEDVRFPNLEYFELRGSNLEQWNVNIESFPCLEELFIYCTILEELPSCFGEITSLKKITIWDSPKLKTSALQIEEELVDFGSKVELSLA